MNKLLFKALLISIVGFVTLSCGGGDNPADLFKVTFEAENQKVNYLKKEFFLKIETAGTWEIRKNDNADWYSFNKTSGQGTGTVVVTVNRNEGAERSSSFEVISGNNRQVFNLIQEKFDLNALLHPNKESYRIEVPRLSNDIIENKSQFVVHYATNLLNYSMEYNYEKRHSRWVAFVFDNATAYNSGVGRTDAWNGDPQIPVQYWTYSSDYAGSTYDRGHLVASADRQYSYEANAQTFYYSNISPQMGNFNTGIWAELENKVRDWGVSSTIRDTLYVVKGGTINEGNYTPLNNTVVPKYYFMAVLAKKGNNYNAIGFYFEHKAYYKEGGSYYLENYTCTIDELETRTGINFFHNLPDPIENSVESVKDNLKWPGL